MPVEFALRPRIRLREAPAPARRARARLPKFALPALAYWVAIGGLVYEFVHHHDPSAPPSEAEAALAPLPAAPPPVVREWWRPLPAPTQAPPAPVGIPEPPTTDLNAPEVVPQAEPPGQERPALDTPASEPARAEPNAESPASSDAPTTRPQQPPQRETRSRIASDLAAAPEPALPSPPVNVPVPAPTPAPASNGLPSCEAALAASSQDVDFSGSNRAADLPTQAIAAVLENGAWLSSCDVPDHTTLDVCVAIKGGRVVGASVTSRPADAALSACVKQRASSLQFPYSPRLDLARTRF